MVKMIEDGNQQNRRAKRTEARALRAEFSERLRLRKTATKPAEFSGPNRSTQTYYIINRSYNLLLKQKYIIIILIS
jgi:hypothetical protein